MQMKIPLDVLEVFQAMAGQLAGIVIVALQVLVVLVVGWVVARWGGSIVHRIFQRVLRRWDDALSIATLGRIGSTMSTSEALGFAVRWCLLLAVWSVAADMAGLAAVSAFVTDVASYLPQLMAAVLILGIGLWLADWAGGAVEVIAARYGYDTRVASVAARTAITVLSTVAALQQAGIAPSIVENVILIALAADRLWRSPSHSGGLSRRSPLRWWTR